MSILLRDIVGGKYKKKNISEVKSHFILNSKTGGDAPKVGHTDQSLSE